jgi:hypothetical protein
MDYPKNTLQDEIREEQRLIHERLMASIPKVAAPTASYLTKSEHNRESLKLIDAIGTELGRFLKIEIKKRDEEINILKTKLAAVEARLTGLAVSVRRSQ